LKATQSEFDLAARRWCLTHVILDTQEEEIRRIEVQSQPQPLLRHPLWKRSITKNRLVEWLKV
jgi:hypothetical protein